MKRSIILCCLAASFLLQACESKTETGAQQETHHEESNIVSLTAAQMEAAGVVLGNIEMKNLTTALSVSGTLEVPKENKAFVSSLVTGVLRTLNVQPGQYVKKGQVIGTIANTELSGIQQQLISVRSQIAFAGKELERQKELVAGNAAPYKNVQRIEAELTGLRAQRKALQQQLSAMGVSTSETISSTLAITAPISGTISKVSAQIGSVIDANTPIAEIINNSELHLDLFVYEKDLPKVEAGQTIHFTLTSNPGKEYDATIYSVGTAFANEARAVPVHAHVIHDKSGLIEGMSVTARISLGENVYPAVPDEAVVNNGGKDYIFILTKREVEKTNDDHVQADGEGHSHNEPHVVDNKVKTVTSFERIQVMRGTSDIGYTEIKPVATLPAGTKVVTKGAFFLMAKMTNAGEAHEH